jgi:hypothetical protein
VTVPVLAVTFGRSSLTLLLPASMSLLDKLATVMLLLFSL